jgi:hypothetical protein
MVGANRCVESHLEVKIKDASVLAIHCPAPSCPNEFTVEMIKSVVSAHMFDLYDQRALNAALSQERDLVYVPTKFCVCSSQCATDIVE